MTSKDISEHLGISRQGAYHLIHTLVSQGFLARTADNRYALGLRVGALVAAFGRHLDPAEHLTPHVRALAATTGETAYASGWVGSEIVVVGVARGALPVQASEVVPGSVEDGFARASGKLLLAHSTPDRVDQYLESHPLRKRTPNTIADRPGFLAELEVVRERGYGLDHEEFVEGVCCLAVPIDAGASPYVIGVSVPAQRFSDNLDSYLRAASEEAARVSRTR